MGGLILSLGHVDGLSGLTSPEISLVFGGETWEEFTGTGHLTTHKILSLWSKPHVARGVDCINSTFNLKNGDSEKVSPMLKSKVSKVWSYSFYLKPCVLSTASSLSCFSLCCHWAGGAADSPVLIALPRALASLILQPLKCLAVWSPLGFRMYAINCASKIIHMG